MAEVRSRLGRRACGFAQRNLTESPNKLIKIAAEPSYVIVGGLWDDMQHGDLCVGDSAYSRVNPLCRSDVTNCKSYFGNKGSSFSNRTGVQISNRNDIRRTLCTSILTHRHTLCVVNVGGHTLFSRTISGNGSRSEPLYKTKTGYYEILEVLPTATQIQIKTAYYKQSFIYHPDRNAGSEEANSRFSDISEAYTVLGNKALRKKYDRGLLSHLDLTATARPSAKDSAGAAAKPRAEGRRSVMSDQIREGIFNFDKFYKAHYNEQLQRQRDIRVRKEDMLRKQRETAAEKKLGKMLEMAVGMLMVMGLGLMISLKRGS